MRSMRLCETIKIAGPIAQIWDHVSTPELWPGFVSKIQVVEQLEDGFLRIDIGGKEVLGKIEVLNPMTRIRFAGQLTTQDIDSAFAIEYRLQAQRDHVVVSEIQEFELPFWIGLLVRFFHRFGTPKNETNLEDLKGLCESDS